jgi:hypothetical protein
LLKKKINGNKTSTMAEKIANNIFQLYLKFHEKMEIGYETKPYIDIKDGKKIILQKTSVIIKSI